MAELDSILSGGSSAAPEAEQVEERVTQAETTGGEGQQEQQQDTGAERTEGEGGGQRMVPHEALHAEKQKVKRYTEEVADFRRQLSERDAAWEKRLSELVEAVKPKQEPQQQPDWFENPDAALNARLGQSISPIANQLSTLQTQIMRLTAAQSYGADKVQAFEKYVEEAMSKGDPEMAALSAQMRASADPMKTGLDWFEKRTFDPEKERERLKAEVLAELQKGQEQEQPAQQRQVFPSNLAGARNVGARSGPAWSGPAPIGDIFNRARSSG